MKLECLLYILLVFSILTLGCTQTATDVTEDMDSMQKKESIAIIEGSDIGKSDSATKDAVSREKEDMMEKGDSMTTSEYKGKVLAGTSATKYLEFDKEDYGKALKEKKKILLYFYANWCPICKAEQPHTLNAFNEINDPDLIGLRVNYRDSETDADEQALAKEFGVAYQHTKVILKDGKQVAKFPDSWNKQRYLDELAKIK